PRCAASTRRSASTCGQRPPRRSRWPPSPTSSPSGEEAPVPPSPEVEAGLRRDLALACRNLAANGHGDNIYGHVSARLDRERILMKAHHVGLEEVTENDVLVLDLDGKVLSGTGKRHTEFPIHTEIMRARPDVMAVVHTHPIHSVALAARGLSLRPVGHEGSFFWPPDVPVFTEFTDLVRTRGPGA